MSDKSEKALAPIPQDLPRGWLQFFSDLRRAVAQGLGHEGDPSNAFIRAKNLIAQIPGLGNAAYRDVGAGAGDVAPGNQAQELIQAHKQDALAHSQYASSTALQQHESAISPHGNARHLSVQNQKEEIALPALGGVLISFVDGKPIYTLDNGQQVSIRFSGDGHKHVWADISGGIEEQMVKDLIAPGEILTIKSRRQLIVEGRLEILGTLEIEQNGKLVIL